MQMGKYTIYMPFADGKIGYHCRECGFQCCQGHGWGGRVEELVQLSRHYPTLPYFAGARRGVDEVAPAKNDYVPLISLRHGCFFLPEDGRCQVQTELGRSFKPQVCRAFPANIYWRSGDVIIIGLHLRLCPLRRASEAAGDHAITHREVLDDLVDDIEMVAAKGHGAPTRVVFDEERLRYEEWCRDLPIEDVLDLAAIYDLTAATHATTLPSAAAIADKRRELEAYQRRLTSFLRATELLAPPSAAVRAELVSIAPSLRFNALTSWICCPVDKVEGELGRLLCALDLYLRLAPAELRRTSVAGIYSLYEYGREFFHLLTQIEQVPTIDAVAKHELEIVAGIEPEAQKAADLLCLIYDRNDRAQQPFDAVFNQLGIDEPFLRIATLRALAIIGMDRIRFSSESTKLAPAAAPSQAAQAG